MFFFYNSVAETVNWKERLSQADGFLTDSSCNFCLKVPFPAAFLCSETSCCGLQLGPLVLLGSDRLFSFLMSCSYGKHKCSSLLGWSVEVLELFAMTQLKCSSFFQKKAKTKVDSLSPLSTPVGQTLAFFTSHAEKAALLMLLGVTLAILSCAVKTFWQVARPLDLITCQKQSATSTISSSLDSAARPGSGRQEGEKKPFSPLDQVEELKARTADMAGELHIAGSLPLHSKMTLACQLLLELFLKVDLPFVQKTVKVLVFWMSFSIILKEWNSQLSKQIE